MFDPFSLVRKVRWLWRKPHVSGNSITLTTPKGK
jgi:hypothetical protein